MNNAGSGLARVTGDFDAAISKLHTDLAEVTNLVAQGKPPWGNDEIGRKFGGDYLATVQKAFTAIASYRDQIDYAATKLPADGRRFSDIEQDNVREFESVWPVPPDGR
ncbi:MAG TPA: hypothetical protein VFC19_53410 [Candidatus Limnocylindrales bacterium]|nr:hypothetical protein [Candidatus Limnocylindrales bacterium]